MFNESARWQTVNVIIKMKKLMFLAALTLFSAATVSASDTAENARNAVCVTLKSGDAKYVAFTEDPVIQTADGSLTVTPKDDGKNPVVVELANVGTITAVYHDFSTDGIDGLSTETGREVKAVYDLSGRQVSKIVPGQVYILKFTDGSTKKTTK